MAETNNIFGMSPFELAQLGIAGASGIAGGYAAGNATKLSKEQLAMQQRLAALQNQQQTEQSILNQRTSSAAAFADRSPLGGEQNYARQQAGLAALLPMLQNMASNRGGPTNPKISGAYTQPGNPLAGVDLSRLAQTVSPDATARAITDRRTALAGIDPTAAQHYRPLSDYGLDQEGVFNDETAFRTNQRLEENDASTEAIRSAAMAQYNLTEQQAQQLEQQGGGGGFWKTLAKIGLVAGGAIATAMTAGAASPALTAAIGAGTGAASGAIDGGWQGALMGGALGGLTGGFGGGNAGAAAAKGAGASTGQLIRESILNPRTIAHMTGAGVGGRTGAAIGLGSNFLPGPNYGRFGQANQYEQPAGPSLEQLGAVQPGFEQNIAGMLPGGGLPSRPTGGILGMASGARQNPASAILAPLRAQGSPRGQRPSTGQPSGSQPPMAVGHGPGPAGAQQASMFGPPSSMASAPERPNRVGNEVFAGAQRLDAPPSYLDMLSQIFQRGAGNVNQQEMVNSFQNLPGSDFIRSLGQQPAAQVYQTPIGGLMSLGMAGPIASFGPRVPTGLQQGQTLMGQLGRVGGDTSRSGLAAVGSIQDELMELFRNNPNIARILLGGGR